MKIIAVYPGRFQPFHMGHQSVYKHLTEQFGSDAVSIATSDKVELPKSPFSFAEKKALMMLTGVPASAIVQTKNPYQAQEMPPLHCTYRGYEILSAPPPSSGGTTICEILNIGE